MCFYNIYTVWYLHSSLRCWRVTCTCFRGSSQCLDSGTACRGGSSSWQDEPGMVYLWSTNTHTHTPHTCIFISTEPQCCPLCNMTHPTQIKTLAKINRGRGKEIYRVVRVWTQYLKQLTVSQRLAQHLLCVAADNKQRGHNGHQHPGKDEREAHPTEREKHRVETTITHNHSSFSSLLYFFILIID